MLAVAHVLGLMMAFFAVTFIMPVVCSLIAQDGVAIDFVVAAGINLVVGLAIAAATRRYKRELKARDGFLLVSLSWVLMSASAAVPLLIALPELSFTDAYFEAMSGLTTTGATVLIGLDDMPASILLWRAALHWFGGIGIIVLAVAVLPLLGVGGMALYRAETPGPVKDEKLTPRITETAKALWLTYTVITLIGIGALKLAGMNWLDAICHTFSAMGLGGFGNHDSSVAFYHSATIEMVLAAIMVAAMLNFSRHFIALRTLSLRPYAEDPEAKAILAALAFSILLIAGLLVMQDHYASFGTALRHATFAVVSVASTTGFATENWDLWPVFAPVWMLFLSCLLCSTGSTGGGIKMFRTLLLARQAQREMKQLVHPSAVIPVRIGGNVVPERIAQSVLAFIFLYFQTIVVLTFALLLSGMPLVPAFSSIVASINNLGPGIGPSGPAGNYQFMTDFQTWMCTIAMLLGRLEIFSVLVLFTPTFWRK
ncbi:MAG: TrkH family potassium uptake protein [Gammaproteobacteria bacterium]|jgi:trk system potassium uptake protein TrkH|nr:TrkH family potassium uptake protein [Gammaproteobacteria bacterium]NBX41021.1 TrkH family potassium uptake protein [Gammaproteobacteria bacterium]